MNKRTLREIVTMEIAVHIIETRCTIRQCEIDLGYARSTIHNYIHKVLKELSYNIYLEVTKILNENKSNGWSNGGKNKWKNKK